MTILVNADNNKQVSMARMIQYKLFGIGLNTRVETQASRRFFKRCEKGDFDLALLSRLPVGNGRSVPATGGAPEDIELFKTVKRFQYRPELKGLKLHRDGVIRFDALWLAKP